jgi:hypothetical protein
VAAEAYVNAIKRKFSPLAWILATAVGNDVCALAGDLKRGAAVMRAVYVTKHGSTTTQAGLNKLAPLLDPNLVEHLSSMIDNGVPANYGGERGVRHDGRPYASATEGEYMIECMTKIWKDGGLSRVFLVSS